MPEAFKCCLVIQEDSDYLIVYMGVEKKFKPFRMNIDEPLPRKHPGPLSLGILEAARVFCTRPIIFICPIRRSPCQWLNLTAVAKAISDAETMVRDRKAELRRFHGSRTWKKNGTETTLLLNTKGNLMVGSKVLDININIGCRLLSIFSRLRLLVAIFTKRNAI